MNTIRIAAFTLLLLASDAGAQNSTLYDYPLSERRVAYSIDATLNPATNSVNATETILWRNPDAVDVNELQFHMYLNAFRSRNSTFMQESGGTHRNFSIAGETNPWGGVDISSMRVRSPETAPDGEPLVAFDREEEDLTSRISFIQPDDGNLRDSTVVSVFLDEPVKPGEVIAIDIEFSSRLPKIFARTGWETRPDGSPFYFVAQWFPKLGVYEVPGQRYIPETAEAGEWSTHQFHLNSEFYADFGTYDVAMTVPKEFTIGATGVYVGTEEQGNSKTVRYRADDVHDFAWTASPSFVEAEDTWRHVNLRVLLQPDHADQAKRHFDAAKIALEWFDENMGEYPYTTLTLVDGIGGSNGMEYPTLITCGTWYKLPDWLRMLELVTIHEFGHQYFYGILASNEAEEAWLDEGMNSFAESVIMDKYYGKGSAIDLPGMRLGDRAMQYLRYASNPPTQGALYKRSWEYIGSSDYGRVTYSKSATVMNSLANLLGEAKMKEFLQSYYRKWRFRHPTTRDLIAVVEEVAERDLSWFFDQFVYGTARLDYAVDSISVETRADGLFTSTVHVARIGDGLMPQNIRVTFDDGRVDDIEWAGLEESEQFTFDHGAPVAEAFIDPDNKSWLDVNRLNNRRVVEANAGGLATKYQFKSAVAFQQLLSLVAAMF